MSNRSFSERWFTRMLWLLLGAVIVELVSISADVARFQSPPLLYSVTPFGTIPSPAGDSHVTAVSLRNDTTTDLKVAIYMAFDDRFVASDFGRDRNAPISEAERHETTHQDIFDASATLHRNGSYRFVVTSAGPLQPESLSISSDSAESIRIFDVGDPTHRKRGILHQVSVTIQKNLLVWGLPALFVLMFLNGYILTPPSEVIVGFAGWLLVAPQHNEFHTCFLVATGGNVAGQTLLYFSADWMRKTRFWRWLIRLIGYEQELGDLQRTLEKLTKTYGRFALVLLRITPVAHSIASIPAAAGRMRLSLFLVATVVGDMLWVTAWLVLGMILGHDFVKYKLAISCVTITIVVIACVILYWLVHKQITDDTDG